MASFRDHMMEKTKNLPNTWDIVIESQKILEDGTVVLTRKEATPVTAVGAHFQRYQYYQLITQLKQRAREENIDIDSEWSTPNCLQITGHGAFSDLYRLQIIYFSLRFYVKERYSNHPNLVTHKYDWPEPFFCSGNNKFFACVWGNNQL